MLRLRSATHGEEVMTGCAFRAELFAREVRPTLQSSVALSPVESLTKI